MKRKRRAAKKRSANVAIGVAWYQEDDWKEWLGICSEFEPTFAEWNESAEKAFREMKQTGANVQKVLIRPGRFRLWCIKDNLDCGSASRAEYVKHLLEQQNNAANKREGDV